MERDYSLALQDIVGALLDLNRTMKRMDEHLVSLIPTPRTEVLEGLDLDRLRETVAIYRAGGPLGPTRRDEMVWALGRILGE